MKKVFFAMALAATLLSFGSVKAEDSSDAINESLIKYRYENEAGKKTFAEVPTFKHLTASVRSQKNECWWDYNQWFNCKMRNEPSK